MDFLCVSKLLKLLSLHCMASQQQENTDVGRGYQRRIGSTMYKSDWAMYSYFMGRNRVQRGYNIYRQGLVVEKDVAISNVSEKGYDTFDQSGSSVENLATYKPHTYPTSVTAAQVGATRWVHSQRIPYVYYAVKLNERLILSTYEMPSFFSCQCKDYSSQKHMQQNKAWPAKQISPCKHVYSVYFEIVRPTMRNLTSQQEVESLFQSSTGFFYTYVSNILVHNQIFMNIAFYKRTSSNDQSSQNHSAYMFDYLRSNTNSQFLRMSANQQKWISSVMAVTCEQRLIAQRERLISFTRNETLFNRLRYEQFRRSQRAPPSNSNPAEATSSSVGTPQQAPSIVQQERLSRKRVLNMQDIVRTLNPSSHENLALNPDLVTSIEEQEQQEQEQEEQQSPDVVISRKRRRHAY